MKKISILSVCIIALAAFAAWAPNVNAFGVFYDNECASCHGNSTPAAEPAQTCAGCHAHGVHSGGGKNDINVTVTIDKAVYLPGEMVTVSIGGGYRPGWVRAKLFDENGDEVDVSSNSCPTCPVGVGGLDDPTENFPGPITLTAQAPLTTGTVMWSASWYGNERDSGNGFFGDFVADPNNSGHGDEIITFMIDVAECTADIDCDDDVACTVDTCDQDTGECVNTANDGNCDDNDVCNGLEFCDPTLDCQPGANLDCDDLELCTTDSCNPVTGCANDPVVCPEGEQCDSADGECKPEPECTVDAECDNGFFCDGAEICDTATGACQAGTPPDCDDVVGCTVDTCDEVNDACVNTPDDASCDDDNVCTGSETCDPDNDCQDGTALDCDDGNLCTTDSCDPLTGCANVPVECPEGEQCDPGTGECVIPPECAVDADCDDNMFCNGAEICDTATGTCQSGTPPDCDDVVGCTVDTCDEVNDECVNTPDDASCDDGDVCNGFEICDPANDCQQGEPLVCDDGNLCTTDGCDSVAGCANVPVECPAGEQCDPGTGECVIPPDCTGDADCDDGMFCNGAETCDTASGTCQPGTPPDCDDGVGCTVDTCDEINNACMNTPDDSVCPDDGLFCTGEEICDSAAGCMSAGDPCPAGSTCNEDTDICDMVTNKVTICHKGKKAKTVSVNALPDHLAHGDTLGPCPDDDNDDDEDSDDGDDDDDSDDDHDSGFNPPPDHIDEEDGVMHAPGKDKPFSNGCTFCHGSELTGPDSGGFAPSCFTCHGKEWDEDENDDGDDDDDSDED